MRTSPLLAVAFLAQAVAATAETAPAETAPADPLTPLFGEVRDIPAEEWRRMVQGRTVTYLIGGEVWAREAYTPGSDTVSIQLSDGTCMQGFWYTRDREYCFAWELGEVSCFRHVRSDGQILVIPMDGGLPAGSVQTVSGISDLGLACGPALTS